MKYIQTTGLKSEEVSQNSVQQLTLVILAICPCGQPSGATFTPHSTFLSACSTPLLSTVYPYYDNEEVHSTMHC